MHWCLKLEDYLKVALQGRQDNHALVKCLPRPCLLKLTGGYGLNAAKNGKRDQAMQCRPKARSLHGTKISTRDIGTATPVQN